MRAKQNIQFKTPDQIRKMRAAGLVVAAALERVRAEIKPGVSTGHLDQIAAEVIREHGAKPSFLGYHGYPATICASVNEQIVHGIPSERQVLVDGDLISVDCGAILDGWHGDSAITVPVGDCPAADIRMADVCADAMWSGIAAVRLGGRLSDISHAVEQAIRSRGGYGIIRDYGGHGIGTEMHQEPHLPNYGRGGRGPEIVPGLVLAIEPMITGGSAATRELADGWTVISKDGSRAAHTEHTFAVLEDGLWVLTAADGGSERLGDRLSSLA